MEVRPQIQLEGGGAYVGVEKSSEYDHSAWLGGAKAPIGEEERKGPVSILCEEGYGSEEIQRSSDKKQREIMKVSDLVDILQRVDQDLEVFDLYDEGGCYYRIDRIPRVLALVKSNAILSRGGTEWVEEEGQCSEEDGDPIVVKERIQALCLNGVW